jgi:hypothetical protein
MIRRLGRFLTGATALSTAVSLAACGGGSPVPNVALNAQGAGALTGQSFARVDVYAAWRKSLIQTQLPGAGCFEASYPSMAWVPMACSTPPDLLFPVPAGRKAFTDTVGNGDDFTAEVSPNLISSSIGSFPSVTGVTSVKTGSGGVSGKNSYTLQLNSAFFSTSACGSEKNCAGWEQFVYENPPGSSKGSLFIQDWLVPANLTTPLKKCPSGHGWQYADGGCVQNSAQSVNIPNQSVTNLGEITETGTAASSGDSVFLSSGSNMYGMKVQSDGITDLAQHWSGSEFNIVGNAGGSKATFNSGATITVSVETNDGATTKPDCPANSGTTGETNNLSFVAAPSNPPELEYPSILFTESNAGGGGSASCDKVAGSGT